MELGILLDTSFLVASVNERDVNHKVTASLKERIRELEFGRAYISDYIFDEFATFLMAKAFPATTISAVGDALLSNEEVKCLAISKEAFDRAWALFKKFEDLSFTDCTTSILAQAFGIKNIATFDSGFDKMRHVRRIV
jgi:uncharacterized protein